MELNPDLKKDIEATKAKKAKMKEVTDRLKAKKAEPNWEEKQEKVDQLKRALAKNVVARKNFKKMR